MTQGWLSLQSGDAFIHAAQSLADRQRTSVDAVLQQFTEAANAILEHPVAQQSPGLTAGEAEIVLRSGGVTPEELLGAEVRLQDNGWTEGLLRSAVIDATTSLSAAQAATAMGVGPSAVRHRLLKHTLWSFTLGGEHRLPLWQFVEHLDAPGRLAPLPGLPRLLAAIPADATPAEVNAVMTTPQIALEIDDRPVTVSQWILAGGSPDVAIEFLKTTTTIW